MNIFTAKAEVEKLTADLAAKNAELISAKAEIEKLNGAITQSQTDIKALTEKLATTTSQAEADRAALAAAKEAKPDVSALAAAKAQEIVGNLGVPPVEASQKDSPSDLFAQLQAIKDPRERTNFFRKHETALKAMRQNRSNN